MANDRCVCAALLMSSFVGVLAAPARDARACTTFLMQQAGEAGPVVGKSYDWVTGAGLVAINKRSVAKEALMLFSTDTPATWTSRYASVTFNQYGVELPNGGMNEAGLVVEIMWLNQTDYPARDERPAVNELQWIQYALDNFATVAELVAAAPSIRVTKVYAAVHYLACDATGDCAAIEYLDGELVMAHGDGLVVPTLANDTYADSVAYLAQFEGFGGSEPIPESTDSLDRFVRASALARAEYTEAAPAPAFSILTSVAQGSFSVWNIVYLPTEGKVYFRTYAEPSIKALDLTAFEPSCTSPSMLLDIDTEAAGDVTAAFVPYSTEANEALIEETLGQLGMPHAAITKVRDYPAEQECTLLEKEEDGGCSAVSAVGAGPAMLLALLPLIALRRRRR